MMFGLCDTITVLVPAARHLGCKLAKGIRAPVVLDRRDDEAALGDIGCGFDVAEAEQGAGVHRPLEHAGSNQAYRDPQLAHGLADRFRQCPAGVVELALLGDVAQIERIGVGLIRMGGAVAENDHVSALAQGVDRVRLRCRGLAVGRTGKYPKQRTQQRQSDDGHGLPSWQWVGYQERRKHEVHRTQSDLPARILLRARTITADFCESQEPK